MRKTVASSLVGAILITGLMWTVGCRNHMPHAFTWPAGGDIQYTHAKPPELWGYYENWDPYAVELEVTPLEDVNPVRTQHVLIATVRDKKGKALPNRRVEWIISEGSVGDIIEVDESGWRASRGYKVTNKYAVSHTNNFKHTLTRGNDDPSDDIHLEPGQTWAVITSPVEGTTHITVYAPGIYNWDKHKVFATKHWYDVKWEIPPPAVNPIGTPHELVTRVSRYSDDSPLEGYQVTYTILDGPSGRLDPGSRDAVSVTTDAAGLARVTLNQATPTEGTNNISIDIMRPADIQCCKPAVHIATEQTSKTWIGPRIAISKTCTPEAMVGDTVRYMIEVTNPSEVDATNVVVTDNIPDGISYVSSSPSASASGNMLTWNLGTLGPRQTTAISVEARASRVGTFENCAEVRADHGLSDRACCSTVVTEARLQLEKSCPAEVIICDPIEYVIVVRNTGTGTATNVRVMDNLPPGITTVDGRTSMTADVGNLGPGEAREVRFSVKANAVGTFQNNVSATADGGLTAEATCTTIVRQPALSVTKQGPEERFIGRNAEYTITVTNTGDAPARDTVLVDDVPAGTEFVGASDGGQFGGGVITWQLGTLEPGASRTVSTTLRPVTRGAARNTARATAYCAEATASTEMQIRGIPAILLEVIDVDDPIEVGAIETYIIEVTNQGSAEGTNIRVFARLPAEMEFVGADGPTAHRLDADGKTVNFEPLPMLAPRAKATWRVQTRGLQPGDLRFYVELISDQMTSPVMETESTHVY